MNRKLKIMANLLLTAAFAAVFTSCGEDEPESPRAIEVRDNAALTQTVFADDTQGESGVTFTTTGAWTSTIAETPSSVKATGPQRQPSAAGDPVTWISITPDRGDRAGDYTVAITLAPNPTGADRAAVITIFCKEAEIVITVTQKAGNKDGSVPATDVTLDRETLDLVVGGDSVTLTATVIPADAADKTVTWTSDAPAVATVDASTGTVKAVAKGTATVTATTANGRTATCAVTVADAYPVEEYPIETVLIPKGIFLMGSSDGSAVGRGTPGTDPNATAAEPNRYPDETQHRVTLTKDYRMSKYPITNAQYAAFLNAAEIDGSGIKAGIQGGQTLIQASSGSWNWGLHYANNRWAPAATYENHPVILVSWYGAKAYAEWAGGDLPTEAQWERAARGGVENRPFGIGDGKELTGEMANFNENVGHTTAVGAYSGYANAYGLYDMHGNVGEWCLDQWDFHSDNYAGLPATDPVCAGGSSRVLRGGSWIFNAQYCRSACRYCNAPDLCNVSIGFRVVFYP